MICFGFIVRFLLCSSTSHKHSLVGRHANGVHTFAGGESEPTTPHLFTQSVILPTKLKKKKKKDSIMFKSHICPNLYLNI